MKARYDKDVDVLLIKLNDNKPEYGEDIGEGIIVHFDKNKTPVEIEILNYAYPYLEIKINCSKGTYIRTLANDIGRHLKTGAYLKELIRTKVGPFNVDDSLKQSL